MTTTINGRSILEASTRVESSRVSGSARDVAASDSGTDFLATLLGRLDAPSHDKPESTRPRNTGRPSHSDERPSRPTRSERSDADQASTDNAVSNSSAPSKSRPTARRAAERDDSMVNTLAPKASSESVQSFASQQNPVTTQKSNPKADASAVSSAPAAINSDDNASATGGPADAYSVTESGSTTAPVIPASSGATVATVAPTAAPAAAAVASEQAPLAPSDAVEAVGIKNLDASPATSTVPEPKSNVFTVPGQTIAGPASSATAAELPGLQTESPVTGPVRTGGDASATAVVTSVPADASSTTEDYGIPVLAGADQPKKADGSANQLPAPTTATDTSASVDSTADTVDASSGTANTADQNATNADSADLGQGPETPKTHGAGHAKASTEQSADIVAAQAVPSTASQTAAAAGQSTIAVKRVEPATESPAPVTTSAIAPTASSPTASVNSTPDAPTLGKPVVATPATFVATVTPHIAAMRRLNSGDHELRVLMRPHELGEVSVSVRLIDGAVHVSMDGALASTRDLLRDSLASLRSALTDAGVNVGSTDIGSGAFQGGDPKGEGRTGSTNSPSAESRSDTAQINRAPRTLTRARPGGIDVLA